MEQFGWTVLKASNFFYRSKQVGGIPAILLAFESLAGAIERRTSRRAVVLAALLG